MRGAAHIEAARTALGVLGVVREHLVLIGGCALAWYARPQGSPLRVTKNVDYLSTLRPWVLQEEVLARLCTAGRLAPDLDMQCRYWISGTELAVDLLSPEGVNVGGSVKWLRRAADHAQPRSLGDQITRVVTPAYFLVLKLAAFLDRGRDLISAKDMEDIVYLAVELDDLPSQVAAAGLAADVAGLWQKVFSKHQIDATYLPDVIDAHVHPVDSARRDHALGTLAALVAPA